ncbi:hypothetical protein NVP1161O_113 [Vibrio phage 1.161.O._10N.261.48.C5]|nr:hypothetical protein NVP1161O_113 [Vibrio phage 1.161.O._10N.261.48.C5]
MTNTTINQYDFSFDFVNNSIIIEALEHIKAYLVDTDYSEYFCDLANSSLGCDPYVIYHAKAKGWLKSHDLDVFDVIADVREYHNANFGEFTMEINPESVVTAYMGVILNDVVGCWLNVHLEEEHHLDLWNEEVEEVPRKLIIKILESEIAAWEGY